MPSNCSFELPTIPFPVLSLDLPSLPSFPVFSLVIPGFDLNLELPPIPFPVLSLDLPSFPTFLLPQISCPLD